MMQKVLRWLGYIFGGLVALVLIAAIAIYFISESKVNTIYTLPEASFTAPSDAASIERGAHLVNAIAGCKDCHGANLGGQIFLDITSPPLARIVAPNLTSGKGGVLNTLSDSDLYRILRYGIRANGKSVLIMPSQDFQDMSDADYGAVIAYLRSLPPVDSDLPDHELRVLGRILVATGQMNLNSADQIDAKKTRIPAPPEGVTAEYGRYLARIGCMGCHRPELNGGPIPNAPPEFAPAANLTVALQDWSAADFINTIRTGVDPDGHKLDPLMPYEMISNQTDDELTAIYLFIKTLPVTETGK